MTELERRALLGDRKAQEECTRQGILLPCPLCGARAAYWTRSSSMRDNIRGWEFGIECVKCSTKLPKSNYHISVDFTQDGGIRVCSDERESALRNWNTRPAPPVGWISVEERLPDDELDGETVLAIVYGNPHENITLHSAIMTAGYFDGEGWVVNEYPEWENPTITHWMPLPEPPKEDA